MQRILFVGQTGELGGAELVMLDIARHFRDRADVALLSDGPLRLRLEQAGVRVRLIAGGSELMQVRRQGRVLQIMAALPALLLVIWRLAAIGRGYDVLYANSQKAAVATLLAGVIARRPVIWHLHDILSAEHFGGLQRRAVVTLANRFARRVIANSQAARDAFVQCGGDAEKAAVVPNGIDPAQFDALSATEVQNVRAALKLENVPLVGLFGRISPWKGQHILIEAMPHLPGVHALLVGDALFGEQEYKAQLVQRAEQLGLAERIHWLGFRDDVPALMRAVDLVLHTSTSPEPFGRVIVEAMMARRPLLATSGGATAEVLGDQSPELVPPGDPLALAEAVKSVFAASVGQREVRVTENDRRARAMFSINSMLFGVEREVALAVPKIATRPSYQPI
jgi:glycosyltransferase involved in cell wall biosynthesis